SSFLGGSSVDWGTGIKLDGQGAAFVGGRTASVDFPTTAGAFDTTFNGGGDDAYVAKMLVPDTVRLDDALSFLPNTLVVASGDSVRWANASDSHTTHTSSSDTGLWNSGSIAPGESFTQRFDTAGTYLYHCTIHNGMIGAIVVEPLDINTSFERD